jgi:multimeric flavodoxin WrbA
MQNGRILIINGSLGGSKGNTSVLIEHSLFNLKKFSTEIKIINLNEIDLKSNSSLESDLAWANGFIITSGTYYDNWGSPLQKFLENTAIDEPISLRYKPVGVLITMHSVGGKEVLSRLQGVLNVMGMLIPPMSGLAYSLASHMALNISATQENYDNSFNDDFWSLGDIEIVIHNLMCTVNNTNNYRSWSVDEGDPKRRWL